MRDYLRKLRDWIAPQAELRDGALGQEFVRQSLRGMRLIGILSATVPPALLAAGFPLLPEAKSPVMAGISAGITALIGVATLALSYLRWSRLRARLLAVVSVWLVGAALAIQSALLARGAHAEPRIAAYFTLLLLVTVATVPIRPLQMLALTLSLEAAYLPGCALAGGCNLLEHSFLLAMSAASTALAAASYAHRVTAFRERRKAEQAHEYLASAQTRVLLSENAASLGRLMGTLAHELNNPLGALSSAIDSLVAIAERKAAAPPEKQERLAKLQAELQDSIRASIERLRSAVSRFERLSALHESEFHSIDINTLLREATALVQADVGDGIVFDFDLQPIPPITCQPQQLTTAFTNLLTNAANATERQGKVRVSSRQMEGRAEVRIQDWGRGIPAKELEGIFEPGYRIVEGRISTANWSLFSSRQIIHGHGGQIYIKSAVGKGSTVVVSLTL